MSQSGTKYLYCRSKDDAENFTIDEIAFSKDGKPAAMANVMSRNQGNTVYVDTLASKVRGGGHAIMVAVELVARSQACNWVSADNAKACRTLPKGGYRSLNEFYKMHGLRDTPNACAPEWASHPVAGHALARSLAVVISNHLNVACASHTAAYLRAKYSELHLDKKEANQLAKTIGRSVQWNAVRASKQVGGLPYEKLPASRDREKVVRRSGNQAR